jgi:triacylglycerol lipase
MLGRMLRWAALSVAVLTVGCTANVEGEQDSPGNSSSLPMPTADNAAEPFELDLLAEASSGYDAKNAYELMRLCDLSYQDESAVAGELAQRRIDPVVGHYRAFSNSSTHTFAYYVEAKGAAFVVFRGTDPKSWQNIAEDGDAAAAPEVVGYAHAGFALALDGVWSDLAAYVRSRDPLPLYVTGHSLGAALATIATARMLLDPNGVTIPVAALYSIASPRAGDAAFANGLAEVMAGAGTYFARIVNECDPVTNMPVRAGPPLFVPFFEHVSYGTDENDFVEWIEGAHEMATSIPFTACPPAGLDVDIGEHMPAAYVSQLAAQL